MKIRQIVKSNFIDRYVLNLIKQKTSYRDQKEQEFKEGLKYFLNNVLFTPRTTTYPTSHYDDCLKQFIYDVLLKESASIGKEKFITLVTALMDTTYSYSLEFVYDKKNNDDYNGEVYCIIRNADSNFIVCIYHIGDGLYLKNLIYLLHEKYKDTAEGRTLYWFAYKYFCGLIIDHALSAIQLLDWAPDNLNMPYFFDKNSATPTSVNIIEFIKGKEFIFVEG